MNKKTERKTKMKKITIKFDPSLSRSDIYWDGHTYRNERTGRFVSEAVRIILSNRHSDVAETFEYKNKCLISLGPFSYRVSVRNKAEVDRIVKSLSSYS